MAPMKLHGVPYSTCTMRVLAVLFEKDIKFEFNHIDMSSGQHKSEKYLLLNPFGQIPAFEVGDLKLFESRAITQYISHCYKDRGAELVGLEPKQMAIIGVGLEVEAHQFNPPAAALCYEICFKPMMGLAADAAVIKDNEAKLAKVLDVYEKRLAEFKYLAGDCFSLADLHHLPCLYYLIGSQVKSLFDARPHVSGWCDDIMARPAWAKVVALAQKKAA